MGKTNALRGEHARHGHPARPVDDTPLSTAQPARHAKRPRARAAHGLPRSAWCNFSGSRCSTHQIYRPQSQTGNKRGGASDSVWNILKDILGVRPMTERNCTLTFKFCPESCVCVHTRARTHITTTKSPLRSCSPPQRDCCPFEPPNLLLRGPDPALQGLGHCSSLRPGGEDRATVQSSPCGRSTAPSALPVGAAVKPRLTLTYTETRLVCPFLAQSS